MIKVFKQYISPRKLFFILGEWTLIFMATSLATYLMLGKGVGFLGTVELTWQKILLVTIITQFNLYFNDLYEFSTTDSTIELASRLIQAIGITSIILAIIYFLWPAMVIGKWIFFISLIILLLFLVSWRFLYSIVIRQRLFSEKVLVVGTGELARDMLKEMKSRADISYDIKYVVDQKDTGDSPGKFEGIPVHIGYDTLCDLAEEKEVSSIIVALDQKRGVMPYKDLLNCKVKGINIIDGVSFYEWITKRLMVEKLSPSWLIFSDGFAKSKFSVVTKRATGLIMASILLFIFSPIMLLVVVVIKLDSPGPALFAQERVGQDGEPFILYKFRSMRADAEKLSGPVWASEDDPRITRIGRLIRKLRIDELPQLWNVFVGTMSFVGPRPERKYFVDKLVESIPYYNERFTVKPGITGWAQIKYPYGSTEKDALEKLKYDLYYIKNMTLAFDLIVMFHTIKIVLLGRGAR